VVATLNGQHIRLPGYIVPLEVSEEGRTTEFLLVPYFGACIHVPPPPSNQIVHVRSEIGVKLEELYQPYWIEGQMQVKPSTSETGGCWLSDGRREDLHLRVAELNPARHNTAIPMWARCIWLIAVSLS
jgi:hypothetical protein